MENKIVLVTGVSRGIGLSIAQAFTNDGYYVVGTSRKDFDLAAAVSSENSLHLPLDVTDRKAIKQAYEKLSTKNLLPNVIVNNAGITKDQIFLRMKDEDWDDVINTNLTSIFNITKVFLKSMVKEREGRVINISSVAGLMGNPGQVNYSSSKAAIGGFTKSLAKEVASRNITVNSIAPGFISSEMTNALSEDQRSQIFHEIPAKKFGEPTDIANLAIFLASEKGQYITGQTISVDGGLYMI